jgi:hypothetical protein
MRPLLGFLFLLSLPWAPAALADDGGAQAQRVVDLRIAGTDVMQRLTLTNGSQFYGQAQSIKSDEIVFRTIAGDIGTASLSEIADLRVVSAQFDFHALPIRRGAKIFVVDRLGGETTGELKSLSAGSLLIDVTGDERVIAVTENMSGSKRLAQIRSETAH